MTSTPDLVEALRSRRLPEGQRTLLRPRGDVSDLRIVEYCRSVLTAQPEPPRTVAARHLFRLAVLASHPLSVAIVGVVWAGGVVYLAATGDLVGFLLAVPLFSSPGLFYLAVGVSLWRRMKASLAGDELADASVVQLRQVAEAGQIVPGNGEVACTLRVERVDGEQFETEVRQPASDELAVGSRFIVTAPPDRPHVGLLF